MLSSSAQHLLSRRAIAKALLNSGVLSSNRATRTRSKSTVSDSSPRESSSYSYPFDENGEATSEVVTFPAGDKDSPSYASRSKPILLNAKEHAVGYLSRILNARVYEAAIETDLQHAKNLSAVSANFLTSLPPDMYDLLIVPKSAFEEYRSSEERGHTASVFI